MAKLEFLKHDNEDEGFNEDIYISVVGNMSNDGLSIHYIKDLTGVNRSYIDIQTTTGGADFDKDEVIELRDLLDEILEKWDE